jgi:hypothetical protein
MIGASVTVHDLEEVPSENVRLARAVPTRMFRKASDFVVLQQYKSTPR